MIPVGGSQDELKLVCPFDTDDPEFVRGFEMGMLWERMKRDQPFDMMVHATNAEMVMRLADAAGRPFSGEEIGEDWVAVRIS